MQISELRTMPLLISKAQANILLGMSHNEFAVLIRSDEYKDCLFDVGSKHKKVKLVPFLIKTGLVPKEVISQIF